MSRRTAPAGALWLLGACALVAGGPGTAGPAIDDLFLGPLVRDVALSPDGKFVAMAYSTQESEPDVLEIHDLARRGRTDSFQRINLKAARATKVLRVRWATDQRLVLTVRAYGAASAGDSPRTVDRSLAGDVYRIVAIDRDGSRPTTLFGESPQMLRRDRFLVRLPEAEAVDGRFVTMSARGANSRLNLYEVDIFTGIAKLVLEGAPRTLQWISSRGKPLLRLDYDQRAGHVQVMARANAGQNKWREVTAFEQDGFPGIAVDWQFDGAASRPEYVRAIVQRPRDDTRTVAELSLATGAIDEPLLEPLSFDIVDTAVHGNEFLGAAHKDDVLIWRFVDPFMRLHWKSLQRVLPGDVSVDFLSFSRDRERWLLHMRGAQMTGTWFVYDTATATLMPIVTSRETGFDETLATTRSVRAESPDGLSLHGFLTLPRLQDASRPPLVVLVDEPELRGPELAFDPQAQAYARSGFAVLRVHPRGSIGMGRRVALAAVGEWAGDVQDDIVASVRAALKLGLVDEERLAVVGRGIGGYAALIAGARRRLPWRAVVSHDGPVDPQLQRRHPPNAWYPKARTEAYWRSRFETGTTPSAERAVLQSPLQSAGSLQVPLLLQYGHLGGIVPFEQASKLADAVTKAGGSAQLIDIAKTDVGKPLAQSQMRRVEETIAFLQPRLLTAIPTHSQRPTASAEPPP